MKSKYKPIYKGGKFKAKRNIYAREGAPALNAPFKNITSGTIIEYQGWVENGELFSGLAKWFFDKNESYFWAGNCEDLGSTQANIADNDSKMLSYDSSVEKINFVLGSPNHAGDQNTIKLRKIINDALTGGKNRYDLQCTEYVQYKIRQLGITIQWPSDRPRNGGKWAFIFEKNKLYKILDQPKKGCAMSFANPKFNPPYGHVAYVEDVFADGSIKISEANWPKQGIYSERTLPKIKWEGAYSGRFIDFL